MVIANKHRIERIVIKTEKKTNEDNELLSFGMGKKNRRYPKRNIANDYNLIMIWPSAVRACRSAAAPPSLIITVGPTEPAVAAA